MCNHIKIVQLWFINDIAFLFFFFLGAVGGWMHSPYADRAREEPRDQKEMTVHYYSTPLLAASCMSNNNLYVCRTLTYIQECYIKNKWSITINCANIIVYCDMTSLMSPQDYNCILSFIRHYAKDIASRRMPMIRSQRASYPKLLLSLSRCWMQTLSWG